MGVRFQCPNGHALHVKANLAGKRGICPDCGARFIVPSFSSGRVPAVKATTTSDDLDSAEQTAGKIGSTVITARMPAVPEPAIRPTDSLPRPSNQSAPDSDQRPDPAEVQWYVRTADATQHGPLEPATIRQWCKQGRIARDALVWRSGWDQWRTGPEAVQLIGPAPPPIDNATDASDRSVVIATVGGSGKSSSEEPSGVAVDDAALDLEQSATSRRHLDRRRRKLRTQLVTFWLALAAVVLAAIFAVIVTSR